MAYLNNTWYCAGWSSELEDRPLGRTILDQLVVMYRDADGVPVTMDGRCPHRFAPLDRGQVVGGQIMCPYHGLRFDRDGKCAFNPHGDGHIPPNAVLRVYPFVEKNGALWIWMGDPALVDHDLLPDTDFRTDPTYSAQTGYYNAPANHMLIVDNLLDLTHGPFLHAGTLLAPRASDMLETASEIVGTIDHKVWTDGSVVHSDYLFPPMPVTGLMRTIVDDKSVVLAADMAWRPGGIMEFDQRFWATEDISGPPIAKTPSSHYLTPETEFTTHYFYSIGRNVKLDDPEEDDRIMTLVETAFATEDGPMVRACQELMGTSDLLSLHPVILKTDQAAILARRIIAKLIRREAHGDAADAADRELSPAAT